MRHSFFRVNPLQYSLRSEGSGNRGRVPKVLIGGLGVLEPIELLISTVPDLFDRRLYSSSRSKRVPDFSGFSNR